MFYSLCAGVEAIIASNEVTLPMKGLAKLEVISNIWLEANITSIRAKQEGQTTTASITLQQKQDGAENSQ